MLLPCVILTTWLVGRHEDRDLGQRKHQETQIQQEPAPRGQGIRRHVSNEFSMDVAAIGVATAYFLPADSAVT